MDYTCGWQYYSWVRVEIRVWYGRILIRTNTWNRFSGAQRPSGRTPPPPGLSRSQHRRPGAGGSEGQAHTAGGEGQGGPGHAQVAQCHGQYTYVEMWLRPCVPVCLFWKAQCGANCMIVKYLTEVTDVYFILVVDVYLLLCYSVRIYPHTNNDRLPLIQYLRPCLSIYLVAASRIPSTLLRSCNWNRVGDLHLGQENGTAYSWPYLKGDRWIRTYMSPLDIVNS